MKPTMIVETRGVVFSILLLSGIIAFGQAAADCVDYGGSDAIPLSTLRGLNSVPKIAVSGSTAFMYEGRSGVYPFPGLTVVDASNPSSPQQIAHIEVAGGIDLAISGSTLFTAALDAGLQVVDISNPSQPAVIGSWTDGSGYQAYGVAAAGSVVYLAYAGSGLKVLDVSNPSTPTPIGSLGIPTRVLTLSGSTLYLQNGHRVVVVDVTDPTSPQEVGSILLSSLPISMVASGTKLYVSTEFAGLQVLDVSNPASPSVIGQLPSTDGQVAYGNVAISGTRLYLATFANHSTLQVIDVSNPSTPTALGTVPGIISSVAVSNDLLYAGAADPQVSARGNLIVGPLQCLSSGSTTGILPGDGKGNALGAAYPNPSLGKATMIPFSLSRPGQVSLRILDITGREVRTLVNQVMQEGPREAKWDGRNNQGALVPTGIYFYQLRSADFEAAQRLVRVRN
jgi:hypothetical protein